MHTNNKIHPLRLGMPIPIVNPTSGGAYELEHAVFNEALKRYIFSSHPLINLIPIAFSHSQFAEWDLDPNQCLLIESISEQQPNSYLRLISNFVKSKVREGYRFLRGIPAIPAKPKGLPLSGIASYVDILWSVTPNTITTSIPFIITVWDLQHRLQPFFPEVSDSGSWPWDQRQDHYCKIARRAFYCVVGTNRGSQELERFFGIDPERILVNPFPSPVPLDIAAIETETILEKLSLKTHSYILYPAQFWSHKNHLCLFYALQSLRFKGIEIKAVLPGSDKGMLASLISKATQLGVRDLVFFPGFISRIELAALYRKALALVFPSFFGPDNLPPLEAMTYRTPSIVASVPGAQEQYGDAVIYFDPFRPEELAACIEKLLLDPSQRLEIVRRGANLASSLSSSQYVINIENAILKNQIVLQCCSLARFH